MKAIFNPAATREWRGQAKFYRRDIGMEFVVKRSQRLPVWSPCNEFLPAKRTPKLASRVSREFGTSATRQDASQSSKAQTQFPLEGE